MFVLKHPIQSTITSLEFHDLKMYQDLSFVVINEQFWRYLFVLLHSVYPLLQLLRLADMKVPTMGKIVFYHLGHCCKSRHEPCILV